MHALYQVQLGEATMCNLALLQLSGKYPDNLRAAGEHGVSSCAINPTEVPPYTRPQLPAAIWRPSDLASARCFEFTPTVDPQNTQILLGVARVLLGKSVIETG